MTNMENRSLIPFGKDRASEQADRGSAESPRTTSPHQLGDSSDARTASLGAFADPNAVRVLRDTTRLLHFEERGVPVCGYDGDVINLLHPLDHAAMWCSACMQELAARSPRKAVDLRG